MTRTAAESYRERDVRIRHLEAEIMQEKMLQDLDWTRMSPEEREAAEADLGPSRQTIADMAGKKAWVRKGPPPKISFDEPVTFHDVAKDPSFPLGAKLDMLESELEKDLKESSLRLDEAYGAAEEAALEQGKPELARETRTAREMFRKSRSKHFEDRPPLPPLFPEKEAEEQRRRKEGEDAVMKAAAERLGREEDPEERDRLALQALSELLAREKDDEGPWRCCMHGKFRPGRCPYCFRHIRR